VADRTALDPRIVARRAAHDARRAGHDARRAAHDGGRTVDRAPRTVSGAARTANDVPGSGREGAPGSDTRRAGEAAATLILAQLASRVVASQAGSSLADLYRSAKGWLREAVHRDPIDANLSFLLGATALFYAAEKGANPKVNTFFDALVYTTTCMSVGYSDIFARTETGKLVGSIIMTVGPALSGILLDPPASPSGSSSAGALEPAGISLQREMLARLDQILAELKRDPAP
jgi:hypothetical protein